MRNNGLQIVEVEKDLGVKIISDLKCSQQCMYAYVTFQGLACVANLWFGGWFGGFPYPVNPGRPEWSKVQTRGKPLLAMAQVTRVSAGE